MLKKKYIFIIDPIEKLVLKKDSSLLLAYTLAEKGHDVYLSFENSWYFESEAIQKKDYQVECHAFSLNLDLNSFSLSNLQLEPAILININESTELHFRKDPPFDRSYLHMCWILQEVRGLGAKVVNDPSQILLINEKLIAYTDKETIPTLISKSVEQGEIFAKKMLTKGYSAFIVKPLDLFQGIGVKKVLLDKNFKSLLAAATEEYGGVFVLQPFIDQVEEGEIRSVFYAGEHIGSIIKIPAKGDFLANIAQGASFEAIELTPNLHEKCAKYANELNAKGVPFCAFDILNGVISEINITCPGLLVEVAHAHKKNVCDKIVNIIERS